MSDNNNGTEHTPRVYTRSRIAATSYECEDCGEIAITPRGFSGRCEQERGRNER